MQLLVYLQMQRQAAVESGGLPLDNLRLLLGSTAAGLPGFIRSTVTIHSVLTDRIDRLLPSQQLSLKVGLAMQLPGFSVIPWTGSAVDILKE